MDKLKETDLDKYIKELKPEELPTPYSQILEKYGIDAVIFLSKLVGGSYMYFPKIERLCTYKRNIEIKKEYNGFNIKELAKKHGVTDIRIRQILKNSE